MLKLTIFKQTMAVNSLYKPLSQRELFLKFINKHGVFFLISSTILLMILIILLVLLFKNSFVVESGMLRNFLVEGV